MSTSPQSRRPEHSVDQDGAAKRRRRGAARLSCAECRRLKLRCDRKVPCDSCVKRGCGAICPDGHLTTGKGNRFVLASTQELHEKINELQNRVRELEDALRADHAQLTNDMHPLLTEELLRIKMPLQREGPTERDTVAAGTSGVGGVAIKEEPDPDMVDSFGSLSISQSGRTKYYGHVANSWYFLQNESLDEQQDDRLSGLEAILPQEILALGSNFPPSSPSSNSPIASENERLRHLVWFQPPVEKAAELRDIYYQRAAFMYNPIPREQFNIQVFAHFYNTDITPTPEEGSKSHRLALLFMVMAIGTLMDTNQPAFSLEAEKFHQLARAALFHTSMFDDPTLNAVQTVFLMSFYLFLADRHGTSSGARWIIMGIAVKLAQSIGLHRDSSRWGIDADETQRRSETFWELYTYDSWQCLTFGRPPSFALAHVDCKVPYPLDDPTGVQSFDTWKHKFTSECMSVVHDQAFGAKSPSYQTILQLDRKLRAFPVPAVLQIAGFGSSEPGYRPINPDTVNLVMQRHIVLAIREMNLLYMHRGFFARAISDHPKDPLGSPYGTSVIAAYRSAGSLVALVRNLDSQLPEPTERLWFLWTHLFSCAIVLGSIVTHCPSMSLAPSALVQLDSACELFSKVASVFRANKVLSIILNLRDKAHFSLKEFRDSLSSPLQPAGHFSGESSASASSDADDELAKLGGKTRLISQKTASSPLGSPPMATRSPTSLNPVVPLPLANADRADPNLATYLSSFTSTTAPLIMPAESSPFQTMYVERTGGVSPYGGSSAGNDFFGAGRSYVRNHRSSLDHAHSPTTPLSAHTSGANMDVVYSAGAPAQAQTPQGFPLYFPVFDYASETDSGYASMHNSNRLMQSGFGHAQGNTGYMNGHGMDDGRGYVEDRASPDSSQNYWMNFVAQLSNT